MGLVAALTKMGHTKAAWGSLGVASVFAGMLSAIQSVRGES
jgi:hypothetical protein